MKIFTICTCFRILISTWQSNKRQWTGWDL